MKILISVLLLVFTSSVFAQDEAIETEVTWYKNFEKRKTTKKPKKATFKEIIRSSSKETRERTLIRLSDNKMMVFSRMVDGYYVGDLINHFAKEKIKNYDFAIQYCGNQNIKTNCPDPESNDSLKQEVNLPYESELKELVEAIYNNLTIPMECLEEAKPIMEVVLLSIIISNDGDLIEVCVQPSTHKLMDQEVLRVANQALKDWKPVNENGDVSRVILRTPIMLLYDLF